MESSIIMKEATLKDGWRRVGDISRYPLKVQAVSFKKVCGFDDNFSIDFNEGITVICGKNGVGKSTLLKILYESLQKAISNNKVTSASKVEIKVSRNDEAVDSNEVKQNELYYLDPSFECSKIINYIGCTENFDELLEGVESNNFLNRPKSLKSVSGCIGKPYKSIEIYEIESALEPDTSFPFFKIELLDGSKYNSLNMGMGEHLCMYLLWYVEWIEPNSILFLEELENYLAAYSQVKILEHLVYKLSEKKIWTIITTHSEHILNKVGISNTRILYRKGSNTLSVKPENSDKYIKALGLKLNKKGLYIVEDYFASFTLKSIVNTLRPELLDNRDIISLRCDSNMEKLIKHYQPTPKPFFDLMTVFDADQSDKLIKISGSTVSAICLPSVTSLSPEEEIWNTLQGKDIYIADSLAVHRDRLVEAIGDYELDDHHDRYYSIAKFIGVTFEQLIGTILYHWLNTEANKELAYKFTLALSVRNDLLPKSKLLSVVNTFDDEGFIESIKNKLNEIEKNEVRVVFDGTDLHIN